jgi:CRP-like cAMP-binding protein
MAHTDEKLELLRRSPFLAGLGRKDLEEVGRLAEEVDVPAGRVLMRQGDIGREFYVIIDGEVELERDGAFLRRMGAGEFFGDISLITERTRTATVKDAQDSRFLVIGHREFHSLLDQFPSIRMGVLESVANRLRSLEPDSVG